MKSTKLIGITPFELPDLVLLKALSETEIFPVLHLGSDLNEKAKLFEEISIYPPNSIGVCIGEKNTIEQPLPNAIGLIIAPFGETLKFSGDVREVIYQIHTYDEAIAARKIGINNIIIKGNEAGGKVGTDSTFILFQRIIQHVDLKEMNIWVQGGIGVHSSASLIALGAKGIILDSQLALFPECSAPHVLKNIIEKLNGNETKVIGNHRVLVRPNSPSLPAEATYENLHPYLQGTYSLDDSYLSIGQDITLSKGLVKKYRTLNRLSFGLCEAIFGHIKQAQTENVIRAENPLAKELNIKYPIAQGPMTRVSDVPAFAKSVSDAGALPFVAMSLMTGEKAKDLIQKTHVLLEGKAWGVGILGFAPPELREEQTQYIMEVKPPAVLIAGGRPSQAMPFEKAGIKTFLHVPSLSLLDIFIKEGARKFVFEGRECGGHVGPLSSLVLWEQQIERILQEDDLQSFELFFAGGIHDSISTAFVSIMTAPLAVAGAKIGILMGSAYIYTKEAVDSGAILPGFQKQALEQAETVLLETAPGHETRCLYSPFTAFFREEKFRLQNNGTEKQEIWKSLEQLNVGRLRIASKGLERSEDQLISINEEDQYEHGMFMIGQVAALNNTIQTMDQLHEKVAYNNYKHIANANTPTAQIKPNKEALDVAIIGMACIYPDAKDIDAFWHNVLASKNCVTEVPDERWNKDIYYDPNDNSGKKSPSKWGGFIPKIDFDPLEFGIPPQSLAAIDPTQLLSLLVAKRALEDSGYGSKHVNKENISVIIGAEGGNDLANNYGFRALFPQMFGEIPKEVDDALPKLTEDSFPGVLANVIAGRITNRLDLGGRNYTVDAACASSLAAVDLACQELILKKSDMVIAGAADLHNGINDYLMFASTHALSKKGRCATFDAEADGIALGEGVAMVVLKRLDDAQKDNDKIYAVIKGVGGSSDGKSLGLTAPRLAGQTKALERAYEQAGVSLSSVGLIEAHGTGTVVGDRTELSALTQTMIHSGAVRGQTHLGSVKTQIGHTKCAAGMAGLIKSALSVYHGIKPPTINIKQPNSYYRAANSPFVFTDKPSTWNDEERIAGVSAFGFGGTNFHALISNVKERDNNVFSVTKQWPAELFVFRGQDFAEASFLLQQVKKLIDVNDSLKPKDLAFSLATYSKAPIHVTILAESIDDLIFKIDLVLSGTHTKDTYHTKPISGKTAFLFAGQGSQRINMARELMVNFPKMRTILKQYPAYEKVLFPNQTFDDETLNLQKNTIKDTLMAQPLLGIVDLAIARFLEDLGIIPDMLAGHSYGELPALAFSGVFDDKHLVPLSKQRAASILSSLGPDKGVMAAINGNKELIDGLLSARENVFAVNHNSPQQWVLAGTTVAMDELMKELRDKKISYRQLEVACAFHSPLIEGAANRYSQSLQNIPFNRPTIPVWSNTSANLYPADSLAIKETLANHIIKPVHFSDQVEGMYNDGARVFIEVGPGKTLTGLVKSILGKDEILLHTEEKGKGGILQLLTMIAKYLATGRAVNLEALFADRDVQTLDFNNPEKYKKSSSTWLVNGQMAVPSNGKLPSYSVPPVIKPIVSFNQLNTAQSDTSHIHSASSGSKEQLTLEYLSSMKMLIQAQRDVLLAYLGQDTSSIASQAGLPPTQVKENIVPVIETKIPEETKAAKNVVIDLATILMDVVSEKTGYPQEMLGMDLDLEADLSIDSIKRLEIIGELRIQLSSAEFKGISQDEMVEQLASIKTLNGLLNWFQENLEVKQESLATQEIKIDEQKQLLSEEDIRNILLEIVSEKTGYPQEMLGIDLDLEADLSIDSIKRIEIIGELRTKLNSIIHLDEDGQANIEELSSFKTLQHLVQWIFTNAQGKDRIAASLEIKVVNEVIVKENLKRIKFDLVDIHSMLQNEDANSLSGYKLAITRDGSLGELIKVTLEKRGATVSVINDDVSLQDYDGLIILDMVGSNHRLNIIEAVQMVQSLDMQRVKWVYVLSDHSAHVDKNDDPKFLRSYQGYTGFIKSLDREYEHTKCRTIHFMNELDENKMSDLLLREMFCNDEPSVIYYKDEQRHTIQETSYPLLTENQEALTLEKEAVVLVLGGAQGITSALTTHLSKEYPCHYVLVGRSAYPDVEGVPQDVKTKEDIRKFLIDQAYSKSPAEIEHRTSQLHKAMQIISTMETIKSQGARVSYHAVDVRDEEKLIQLIQSLYAKYGRIDGVIHGAGILEDKLFQNKTPDSFERVFSTKVTPIRVLAEHLKVDTKFIVFFSSIASVYGNRGQTDYAAANSVLDHYAEVLRRKMKGRVMAINWGPWKGAGMVSASLEKEYERRGISLIPLESGKEIFTNEIKYGKESRVLIMA